MAASEMRKLGLAPKVALLSHSNFGSSSAPSAVKMREVLALIQKADPTLEVDGEMHGDSAFEVLALIQKADPTREVDGEMHGDSALDETIRASAVTSSPLKGDANLLVLPNIDAANISYNLLKTAAGNGIAIGPLLLGAAKPIHILTPSATVRRIVNVTTLAVVEAASNARGVA